MKRGICAILGWMLLAIGVLCLLVCDNALYGLTALYFGFFARLIFNSEKYKFFKYVHLKLLWLVGACQAQLAMQNLCLWGFYRGVVDFIAVIVLPFIIIPNLHLPWYVDTLIAMAYYLSLKPIFKPIDKVDKELAERAIDQMLSPQMNKSKN